MAKRARNEGSIYRQQTDGRWVAAISVGYRNGRRRRKKFFGATRGAVAAQLTQALHDHQHGLPVAPDRQTVGTFLTRWLEDSVKPSVRPTTYRSYQQLVDLHLKPGLGRYPLAKLTPQQVQTFLNDQHRGGRILKSYQDQESPRTLTPRTVQYIHAVLRRALNQAMRWGMVPRNVAALVTPPRVIQQEVQPFTPQQARDFLGMIATHRLCPLIAVALSCGLRQGEALGLRWADGVDLDQGMLHVRHALQTVGGTRQLVELKTARSRRTLTLPATLVTLLRAHRTRQRERQLAASPQWHETGFVFTTRDGQPLDGGNVTRDFKKLLAAAGLPPLRFHDLRHSCASFLLAQGVSPRVVMEILGHSQISLTMNTYAHVLPSLQTEAAHRMNALLWADDLPTG